jgi:hypothetical protein
LIDLRAWDAKVSPRNIRRLNRRIKSLSLPHGELENGVLREITALKHLEKLSLFDVTIPADEWNDVHLQRSLRELYLPSTPVPHDFAWLGQATAIESLVLSEQNIDDDCLIHLIHLPLWRLDLTKTAITDAGMAHLARMPRLVVIDVSETAVTDVGIEHLLRLPELKSLEVRHTGVSSAMVQRILKEGKLESLHLSGDVIDEALADDLQTTACRVFIKRRSAVLDARIDEYNSKLPPSAGPASPFGGFPADRSQGTYPLSPSVDYSPSR